MDATIDAVRVAGTDEGPLPVVLLAPDRDPGATPDPDDVAVLPIFIGLEEAMSIVRGLDAESVARPLTHDLMLDVIEALGGRVDRVVVGDLVDDTYVADIHVNTAMGKDAVVDARPSDSLALAARTNAPIEIAESVFETGSQPRGEFDGFQDIREVVEVRSP